MHLQIIFKNLQCNATTQGLKNETLIEETYFFAKRVRYFIIQKIVKKLLTMFNKEKIKYRHASGVMLLFLNDFYKEEIRVMYRLLLR